MKQEEVKTDLWMPIFIGDYLSATTRLTTEMHGAYLLLLMDYWKNGPLPDDDYVLAQIVRMPIEKWMMIAKTIRAFFAQKAGNLIHNRVEKEIAKTKESKKKAKERGSAAAKARWEKQAASNAQAMLKQCSSNAQAMLKQCTSNASGDAQAMLGRYTSPSHISLPSMKKVDVVSMVEGEPEKFAAGGEPW